MGGRAKDETQQDWNELPHPPCSKLGGSSSGNRRYSFSNCHLHTLIDNAANKVLQCSVGRLRQYYFLSVTGLYRENWDRLFQPPSRRLHGKTFAQMFTRRQMPFKLLYLLVPMTCSAPWISIIQPWVPVFRLLAVTLWSNDSLAHITGPNITLGVLLWIKYAQNNTCSISKLIMTIQLQN